MKALISGQAGLTILLENNESWVIYADRPDERLPCLPSEIPWLLADVVDLREVEDANQNDVANALRQASRADRALQLVLILLDRDEDDETVQMAAEVLEGWLKDELTLGFVECRLYSGPLPSKADAGRARQIARRSGVTLFDFLAALDNHQAAIRTARESWEALPWDLFREIDENRKIENSDTEALKLEKQTFERVGIESGLFRYFARSIQAGTEPSAQSVLAACAPDARLRRYGKVLSQIVREWAKTAAPNYRAMIAIQLLAVTECLRLKRFAKTLIVGLGLRAQGWDYQELLREAVRLTIEEGGISEGSDLEESIVGSMRSIAGGWAERAALGEQPDPDRPPVWEAVLALKRPELLRLQRYSRWRIRWLGRKALGRDEKDLLDEAITATVSGRRLWTRSIPLRQHLLGAMRSISTSWYEKKAEEYLESDLVEPGAESPLDRIATTQDPEKILEAKERLDQVRKLFEQDTVASKIVSLLGLGYTAKEIQIRLSITSSGFAAAAKRIRRRLDSWHRSQGTG